MSVTIGTQLGSLEITALLGKGGMGEVYRARDRKLKRDVAIKILPEGFTHDADRVSRFQREAEVLASLNHPNIAAIYDLVEFNGVRLLVLELVEGETLADKVRRGPVALDEALTIARSIAEALEAAHEKGVIHRDLKPANVKITPDGKVKVLDFGLAKVMERTAATALSDSPTLISMAGSNSGVILGTPAYMSPEQAKGRTVDRRTDIFAFGCLLSQMLTGRPTFDGEDVSEILARIQEREPDWTLLPANVPPSVRQLLRLCLEKDVRKRRSDAADVRIDIEQALAGPSVMALPVSARTYARSWMIAAAVFLVATAALTVPAFRHYREAPPPEIRLDVMTSPTTDPFSFAISPDGRRLVYAASNEGKSKLWVRPLGSVAAQALAGTEGASYPFWSPDSASVGFFADGKLKRIDLVGGVPQALANVVDGRGGAWNRESILFAPLANGPLSEVSAAGGEPAVITRMEAGQGGHRFPQFLPDGRHFIYSDTALRSVYVGSLDGSLSKRLLDADSAAVVSPAGFLLFGRQTTLFAQAFDFRTLELTGNPVPVAEPLAIEPAVFVSGLSVTSDIVAYRTRAPGAARQLTWLDRSGKALATVGDLDPAGLSDPDLSPDGKRIAVTRTVNSNDVWLIDAIRGVPTRFTFDAAFEARPIWSPDGLRVAFQSNRSGVYDLYSKAASGAGADELLLESDRNKAPMDFSFDGRMLLYRSTDPKTGWDLWALPMSGDRKPFPFLKTSFEEYEGQFSPDAKWVAYQSNESGRFEIYVQPFPGPGGKFQISANGGAQPRWNRSGNEIFYVSLDAKMMATPVTLSPNGQSLETGTPAALFPVHIAGGPLPGSNKQQYAVSADGQRFLVNLEVGEQTASSVTIIFNWRPPK